MPMVSSCRTFYWLALGGLAIASDAVIAQQDAKVPMTAGAPSLVEQAIAYEHGEGVPKDQARAAVLYCEAARKGDPEAQMGLGWMFANGRGVARDEGIAASLFALAAAAGNPYAQTALRFLGGGRERLPECMHEQATPELAEGAQPTVLPDPFADLPPKKQKIVALVTKLAPAYTIDTRLALAIIAIESNFEPQARSPKNARGLMQLIPFTAERFHVKNVSLRQPTMPGRVRWIGIVASHLTRKRANMSGVSSICLATTIILTIQHWSSLRNFWRRSVLLPCRASACSS